MAGRMATPIPRQMPRASTHPISRPRQMQHGHKSVVSKVNAGRRTPKVPIEKPIVGKGIVVNVSA